jgi:hypothetical protein
MEISFVLECSIQKNSNQKITELMITSSGNYEGNDMIVFLPACLRNKRVVIRAHFGEAFESFVVPPNHLLIESKGITSGTNEKLQGKYIFLLSAENIETLVAFEDFVGKSSLLFNNRRIRQARLPGPNMAAQFIFL